MPTNSDRHRFESTPLLTPERIATDPGGAFSVLPSWVHSATVVFPEGYSPDVETITPAIIVTLGRKHVTAKGYSLLNAAVLWELTRVPGISVATNSNGMGRHYERITFDDAGEDLTTISRFLFGAGPYDQMKVGIIKSDMRPENIRADPAAKLGKDARSTVMAHVERKARAWEESGRMPSHITADIYLANLKRLLAASDLEASGIEFEEGRHLALSRAIPTAATSSRGWGDEFPCPFFFFL